VFEQLLSVWYLLPLGLLVLFFSSPTGKGWFGEFLVNQVLKRQLSSGEYHLLKDVTIPTEDGTTQIDHILVSQYGIFVIETKHYRGWIFGSEKQATWTQTLYKSKFRFQNPLRQNYKHIMTLGQLLGFPAEKLHSVIVFTGDAQFKTAMPGNVVKISGLSSYIGSKQDVVLSMADQQKAIQLIENNRLIPSRQTNKQHSQHVKDLKKEKLQQPICSKCGAFMVLRIANKGQNQGKKFWGCSNYPKCRQISTYLDTENDWAQ
jgi:ribosomal protein L37AE/L43A